MLLLTEEAHYWPRRRIVSIVNDEHYFMSPAEQTEVKAYELKIYQQVHHLYWLTPDEVKLIESTTWCRLTIGHDFEEVQDGEKQENPATYWH